MQCGGAAAGRFAAEDGARAAVAASGVHPDVAGSVVRGGEGGVHEAEVRQRGASQGEGVRVAFKVPGAAF